jgi:hypothetical protein
MKKMGLVVDEIGDVKFVLIQNLNYFWEGYLNHPLLVGTWTASTLGQLTSHGLCAPKSFTLSFCLWNPLIITIPPVLNSFKYIHNPIQ